MVAHFILENNRHNASQDRLAGHARRAHPEGRCARPDPWVRDRAEWAASHTGREARFYSLTRLGRQQLEEQRASWDRLSAAISSILSAVNESCGSASATIRVFVMALIDRKTSEGMASDDQDVLDNVTWADFAVKTGETAKQKRGNCEPGWEAGIRALIPNP